jgi:hypothetical protein
MDVDNRFPTKLESIDDVPEPLRGALRNNISASESVRLLIHAPAFSTLNEESHATPPAVPAGIQELATVLAVLDNGWLVAREAKGGVDVEKSGFDETLFLELTSILLSGQLKIYFASVGTVYSAVMQFNTVGENLYQEAINVILDGVDQKVSPVAEADRYPGFEKWPMTFRLEAERYRPKGQRLLAATQWPSVTGGFERQLASAGALLVTERELVLISEEKASPRRHVGDLHAFGGIITYFPLQRLADFHIARHGRFGILALQVLASHGGEKLEFIFPADRKKLVAKAMQSAVPDQGSNVLSAEQKAAEETVE